MQIIGCDVVVTFHTNVSDAQLESIADALEKEVAAARVSLMAQYASVSNLRWNLTDLG